MKNIFIFDKNKCVACGACKIACLNENGFQEPEQWRNIYSTNSVHNPNLALIHLSMACNHCDDSPCLVNCPALAYSRDENTGAVIHNGEKCIGCKYCTWTCPFDAPKYNSKEGIITKCTFCVDRIKEGLKPACANLCPTGALEFDKREFSRKESNISSQIGVEVGSNIKIIELIKDKPPEMDLSILKLDKILLDKDDSVSKISVIKEWPLFVFTFIMAAFVAVVSSDIIKEQNVFNKILFLGTGAIASLFSMLHLGKKMRSWRSILNISNSWLSREIICYSLLISMLFFNYFVFPIPNIILRIAGVLLLISIDMLYTKAMWKWPTNIHSGQTLLISAGLFALLTYNFWLVIFIYIFRIALKIFFEVRKDNSSFTSLTIKQILIISGLLLYFLVSLEIGFILIILFDIIDRIDFYNALRLPIISNELK